MKGAGHYGIFSGRRWREMVYPIVKDFILAHQAAPVAETAAPAAAEVELAPTPAIETTDDAQQPVATDPGLMAQEVAAEAKPRRRAPRQAT